MAGGRVQTGPALGMVVDCGPGKGARIADDIAVDQVADAPEELPTSSEERCGVKHDQRIDPLMQGTPEKHGENGKDRAEEGHPAFPGGQNAPGLLQVARDQVRLLADEIEASADEASHDAPPEHAEDLVLSDPLACGVSANTPQAHDNADHIHQAIPAQRQGTKLEQDRVDVEVNIRADLEPAPIDKRGQREREMFHLFCFPG